MKYFMGIDIGTFGSKGALVDEQARIVAEHAISHEMEIPHPGYAEHDAEKTWWGEFCAISKQLIADSGVDPKEIAGVGCSTIGPCCLPVDEQLNPLRKAILYGIDCRAVEEIAYLENLYGKDAIFQSCGTPLTTQARCLWSHEVAGTVTKQAAQETGLAEGTPVTTGTADASAEAFSVGVLNPGDMMLMYGSSIFIIHVVKEFTQDERLWAGPYLFPGTYSVAAGMSCAGTLTHWFRDNFALDLDEQARKDGANVYGEIAKLAQGIPAGSEGLVVLPYFSGERTPINDPKAKGMIFGLGLQHTRGHIYKALLEGVGYGINQHFEIFDALHMGTKKVMAVGGGTKNPTWLQAVSDISGKQQHVAQVETGAAYGDALIAALATGHYRNSEEVQEHIKISRTVKPNAELYETYAPYRSRYNRLYLQTRDIMSEY